MQLKTLILIGAFTLSAASLAHAAPLAKYRLVACSAAVCGDYAQNVATMTIAPSSLVEVAESGRVNVKIVNLQDKATGAVMAHKTLELRYGTVFQQQTENERVGFITTDKNGNFSGRVGTLPGGRSYTGHFFINDPAIPNTQFSTGFAVP